MLVLGGTLVAVGGLEAASCERYDAARDAWVPCGDAMDLPGVRDFACAVVAWPECWFREMFMLLVTVFMARDPAKGRPSGFGRTPPFQ